ncbi:arylsulfatase [Microlunatus aurantiacus]|uniref:Arylsulfatase n=1 Tax=Microlunatus aurantiacus TaxID=446786 RepID=A0ABP7D0U3_9ACTN
MSAPEDRDDPYAGFPGRIGRTISESEPAWPEEPTAAVGSPNVVVILVDDLGFADIGPYGSEIATPHLDRLARDGVSFTDYHTTPLCSPSRAALLTGLNPHKAGFAYPANADPGYPAYAFTLPDNAPTVAETLRDHGYATFALGKWHLAGDRLQHDGADKGSWPCQRGFDRYFGSLEGFTSLHAPHRLVWDNSPYPVQEHPDGYYLTDDLTERALDMITTLRASDPVKPFLLYLAHAAVHGPVQAKESDIADYAGVYDAGWDHIRSERFRRQIDLGLFGDDTVLPPANHEPGLDVPPWDSLDHDQQRRFARYMEVYAAAVQAVDASTGRLIEHLERLGELDNTIIVFTSDNGATAEGGAEGTRSYYSQFAHVAGLPDDWDRDVDRDLELIGGPQTTVHYPRGWGQASNTPFRLYKAHTFAGGIRAPLIVHWPAGALLGAGDDGLRRQYLHVTDLTPTLLDLLGIAPPDHRHGRVAPALDGVSAAGLLRDPGAASVHGDQYTETAGQRAYQSGHWKIVTRHRPGTAFDDAEWQLYDLSGDPTETTDLAPVRPEVVAELAAAWERAAWANRVFPLDDHGPASGRRRPDDARFGDPVTLRPFGGTVERWRSAQLVQHRDVAITASFRLAAGDAGVLVAHGDQGGGYLLAVDTDDRGEPVAWFGVNAYGVMHRTPPIGLALGESELLVQLQVRPRFRLDVLLTDGRAASTLTDLPQLVGMAPFTGISVGADRGGPVDWEVRRRAGSHPFSGVLHAIHYRPGPLSADAPAERARVWAEGVRIYD